MQKRAGPSPGGGSKSQTRDALLDAAEEILLELGVDATSLRAVTGRAGANLAAVSYHFGSKEGLVRAVFDRRLRPVNEERLRRLSELEAESSPAAPSAESVLRAFLEPVVRCGGGASVEQMRLRQLLGRTFAEPGESMQQRLRGQFQEVGESFLAVLARCFPHLPPDVLLWRFHFMLGSIVQVALHGALISEHSGGLCDPTEGEEISGRLVEFLLGGFGATAGELSEDEEGSAAEPESRWVSSVFAWDKGF